MNGADHEPNRNTERNKARLGKLQTCFDCFRHCIRRAESVKPLGMRCITSTRYDRYIRTHTSDSRNHGVGIRGRVDGHDHGGSTVDAACLEKGHLTRIAIINVSTILA